jgi:hypothetical protein
VGGAIALLVPQGGWVELLLVRAELASGAAVEGHAAHDHPHRTTGQASA